MGRRVVVTGVGVVSSIGVGVDAFWDALANGVSGASVLELEGEPPTPVCRVKDFDGEALFGRRDSRRMDRCAQLATAAAQLALADAGELGLPHERIGASIGSAHGGMGTLDEAYRTYFERGSDRVSPFMIPLALTNTACAAVARTLQLRGPSSSTCTACAAGADAIGTALWLIRSGRADAMLAGGSDSAISPVVLAGYRNLGALATLRHGAEGASRPFDSERDGFVIGEGSGVLALEEREHALARGARIYAELAGYGSSCDASHLTDPDETGAGPGTAMTAALEDAGLGSRGHRLRQRPRHLDALGRRSRGARDQARRPGARRRLGHQVAARPHARRRGRRRGRRLTAAARARHRAAHAQPRGARRRLRPRPRDGLGAARRRRARVALEQLRLRRPQRRARARQGVTRTGSA